MKIQVANIQKQSFGGVLRNFAKFTAKHLCQSLFLNKVAGSSLFMEHLWWLLVILQIWFLKEKILSKWPPFYKQQVASVLLESCYYNFIEIVIFKWTKACLNNFISNLQILEDTKSLLFQNSNYLRRISFEK